MNIMQIVHCFEAHLPEYLSQDSKILLDIKEGGTHINMYIKGISGNRGTDFPLYFPKSNDITLILHFTNERLIRISEGNNKMSAKS